MFVVFFLLIFFHFSLPSLDACVCLCLFGRVCYAIVKSSWNMRLISTEISQVNRQIRRNSIFGIQSRRRRRKKEEEKNMNKMERDDRHLIKLVKKYKN